MTLMTPDVVLVVPEPDEDGGPLPLAVLQVGDGRGVDEACPSSFMMLMLARMSIKSDKSNLDDRGRDSPIL